MKFISTLFILFGILWCFTGGYYLWQKNNPDRLSFQNYKQEYVKISKIEQEQSVPKKIVIADLGIDLFVIPAKVENNKWEITDKGVSYLTSSPIPGTTGNSIIYGHNWSSLFGNLTKAVPGQVVEIIYEDKSKKKFIIEYTSIVSPSESSILNSSDDKRITLYTCTGFLDSKRFVVVAYLDKNSSFANVRRW